MQSQKVYQPQQAITGAAFSARFKLLATLVSVGLVGYVLSFLLRYPAVSELAQLGLLVAIAVVLLCWRDFLRATLTIDAVGIRQSGWLPQHVVWDDVRGARLIGQHRLGWLLPPRLAVRTGTAFYTFNGGTQDLLTEFARISAAFEMPIQ